MTFWLEPWGALRYLLLQAHPHISLLQKLEEMEVQNHRRYRVLFTKKPLGLLIQTTRPARVLHVSPGYPGELSGVHEGFVLVEINDQPVDAETWYAV